MLNYSMWFEEHLKTLEEPTPEQKVWCQHPERLTVLFIEGNRKPLTKYNLWNIAHVYGGTDVGLHIICSPRNLKDMKEWTKDWTNVVITWYPLRSVSEYSHFTTSPEFHMRFVSSHVLLMHWDSYIFRKIDEHFFEYDYIGAPWKGCLDGYSGMQMTLEEADDPSKLRVGNGGFSLHKIYPCLQHCIENTDKPRHIDDVFFAHSKLNIPSVEVAYEFAIESRLDDIDIVKYPVGIHKIWDYGYGLNDFKEWGNIEV
jgi:hypothetical protein